MIGTLLAIIVAGYLLLFKSAALQEGSLPLILPATVLFFSSCLALLQGWAWSVLQQAELKATPRILELYWQRGRWLFGAIYLLAAGLMASLLLDNAWQTVLWIVLLGIIADALYHTVARVFTHLTPPTVLPLYGSAARKAIQQEKPGELCQWIDASIEAALQSVEGRRPTFCLQVFDELQGITKNFFQASKSISHNTATAQPGQGQGDTVVYVLLFILQRLELLGLRSTEQHLEPVVTGLVTTLGKMTIDAARYDISVAQYPLHYLGRITHQAVEHGMPEVAAKASYTLIELARQIVEQVDLTYLEIADFFIGIVNQLEDNAKVLFKKDRGINVKVLQQPFLDLKALFQKDKLAQHRDTPNILRAIDSGLGQFQALEELLQGMPTVQGVPLPGAEAPVTPPDDEGLSAKIVQELEERLGGRRITEPESDIAPPPAADTDTDTHP